MMSHVPTSHSSTSDDSRQGDKPGTTSFDKLDLSTLDPNQQTLFKIAWHQYINDPTPQWFNVLMSFLKDTNQLKTEDNKEWQQLKQLSNDRLISLIKPEKYSPPVTPKPHSSNSLMPSN